MVEILIAVAFVAAATLVEHRFRQPLVRLALALVAFVVLALSQPPGLSHRGVGEAPAVVDEFCALGSHQSEADRWYCTGYLAAVDRWAKNYWIGMPTRLAAVAVLLWLFTAPALRQAVDHLARGAGQPEAWKDPGDGAASR